MNIVLYAGDNKYYKTLLPIAKEIKKRDHNFLFLYSEETQLQSPHQKGHFSYDGRWPDTGEYVESESLLLNIPFKPDLLIIARERWQPEQSIIFEFKSKFDAKVACVEVSSHLLNNIENRLEMLSRMTFPQNTIDYFFEHSEFAKERRIDCMDESFRDRIVVTGNPRFSDVELNLDNLRKYDIDPNKKQILFWGIINTTRDTMFEALNVLAEKTKDTHQIFYKCYPGEPANPNFVNQFNPFVVDGVQVVYEEDDIFDIANLCDIHIGAASSIFNFAFYFDKVLVNLDSVCDASNRMNDMNVYTSETTNGVEDSAKFWMGVWNIQTIEEFKSFVDMDRLEKFKETNGVVMDLVKKHSIDFDWDCKFLDAPQKNYGELLTIFDEYGLDGGSPQRIVNFLEKGQ
tara:strand:+ start:420 stop:1622 length:1203 start_codon:yes stop_codon:yes gene_type:complete